MNQSWYTSRLTIDVIHTFGRVSQGRKQVNKQLLGDSSHGNLDFGLKLRSIAYRYPVPQLLGTSEYQAHWGVAVS